MIRDEVALIVEAIGAVAELGVALFIYLEFRHANRAEKSRVTENIYAEWWSDSLREHRRYFYQVFLEQDRPRLVVNHLGLKDLRPAAKHDDKDERHKVMQLCYFFDRVGFLGASGLLDVDYVLAPMQHVVRRAWWAVAPLVERSRESGSTYGADPNFLYGFEWLYTRTESKHKDQTALMRKRFQKPEMFNPKRASLLKAEILAAEQAYKELLATKETELRDQHTSK